MGIMIKSLVCVMLLAAPLLVHGGSIPKTQDEVNPKLQKRLNRNGRRLCKHTAWWNPSDCKACKHSAAFLSAMAKRNARNAGVELPKTQDEQNPELQKRLNRNGRRLCKHTE